MVRVMLLCTTLGWAEVDRMPSEAGGELVVSMLELKLGLAIVVASEAPAEVVVLDLKAALLLATDVLSIVLVACRVTVSIGLAALLLLLLVVLLLVVLLVVLVLVLVLLVLLLLVLLLLVVEVDALLVGPADE